MRIAGLQDSWLRAQVDYFTSVFIQNGYGMNTVRICLEPPEKGVLWFNTGPTSLATGFSFSITSVFPSSLSMANFSCFHHL